MNIGDKVLVVTDEPYNGKFYGIRGQIEEVCPDSLVEPYPYEVSFGDSDVTWPFNADELELIV